MSGEVSDAMGVLLQFSNEPNQRLAKDRQRRYSCEVASNIGTVTPETEKASKSILRTANLIAMSSFKVRVADQADCGMEIETEYNSFEQRYIMSMSSEQPSFDNQMVQELPTSHFKHVDDEEWEISSTAKNYVARLKKARFQRQQDSQWNQSRIANDTSATREGHVAVEKIRGDPKGYRRPSIVIDRPVDKQREERLYRPPQQSDDHSLFSPSTMSDSESLLEEEKVINTERYHRMISDPYAFTDYSAADMIPQMVVVSIKSSGSEDLGKVKRDDTQTTEENESAVLEKSGSDDSWDILNKYDGNAGALEGQTFNPSKGERVVVTSGDELMGPRYTKGKKMDSKPPAQDCPSPATQLGKTDNAALDPTMMESHDWGDEPEPSFGNVLDDAACDDDAPCDELLATKTSKEEDSTAKREKASETPLDRQDPIDVTDTEEEDTKNASIDKNDSLSNDFPEQSVLELLMKRVEMSKQAKKQAEAKKLDDVLAAVNEQLSEESPEQKRSFNTPVMEIDKQSFREEVTAILEPTPQQEEWLERESLKPQRSNGESSKALLDSAFKMIARLEKENAEKDDRLRSSSLYIETIEKKLFEDKMTMDEERKRRATMDSEEVSRLKDKVSSTLHQLSAEEGQNRALKKLINELKDELKQEQNTVGKNQEESFVTKELLEREQSQVKQLQEILAARDQTLEDTMSRVVELNEKLALSNKLTTQEGSRATELREALEETEAELEKTRIKLEHTSMQLNGFHSVQNASGEIRRNEEIMKELKQSIESKQKLIDQEEEKKKELLSKQLENAALAEDHQASAKKVEKSLEKYYQLIQKEKEEVQRLKDLGKDKEKEVAKEKSLLVELENTIVRKHAMVDLEKVKQRALESSIAQKARLVEVETSKMREHKTLCAERLRQIEVEKEAIHLAIQEKEELLASEKAAIEYLQQMINTKKLLREEKKALEKANPTDYKYVPYGGTTTEPKRASFTSSSDMDISEQMVLQELGKMRSYHGRK